jgi:hypothetical protein
MYTLGIRYPTFGSFANTTMSDAFGEAALKRALHYEADTFASMYLHNDGGGKFSASPLPNLAQIAPIKAMVAQDVDGDGNLDLPLHARTGVAERLGGACRRDGSRHPQNREWDGADRRQQRRLRASLRDEAPLDRGGPGNRRLQCRSAKKSTGTVKYRCFF